MRYWTRCFWPARLKRRVNKSYSRDWSIWTSWNEMIMERRMIFPLALGRNLRPSFYGWHLTGAFRPCSQEIQVLSVDSQRLAPKAHASSLSAPNSPACKASIVDLNRANGAEDDVLVIVKVQLTYNHLLLRGETLNYEIEIIDDSSLLAVLMPDGADCDSLQYCQSNCQGFGD